jgi:hypothetical protein
MVLTLDIPESIVREAESRGMAVEELVRERLEPDFVPVTGRMPFGSGPLTPAEAADDIRKLRVGVTLGGEVTIKQLIEEGRP